MKENTFVWADLSSYQPEKTKKFYENVFGWKYYEMDGYYTAYKGEKEIVGLYQTPIKFQEMNMPSFWMSYIQVDDVFETVEKATSLGAIIELIQEDTSFGSVALIRDPLGAGFTVYDGNQLNARTNSEENTLIFNELHVSDANKVIQFYQEIFNWEIIQQSKDCWEVREPSSGERIANIFEIENTIKSKYEYWVCTFGVKDVKEVIEKIKSNKGVIVSEEGNRVLCSDGSEAFFYIQQV